MTCDKKAYTSKSQADKRAANLEVEEGKALYSYQCRSCGRWHLTKKRQAELQGS